VTDIADVTNTLNDVANRVQKLADNAMPAANRIASLIRMSGILGLIGGVLGAAAISLPGFGFIRSWPFFLFLLGIALFCGIAMFRWAKQLRTWTGDVKHAVLALHNLPSPTQLVERLQGSALKLAPSAKNSGRSNIFALVRGAQELRNKVGDLPGAAQKAKDLMVQLTGPFRPPFIAMRLTLLMGGLIMVLIGPFLALIALIAR
jgi:hypothetical protein